MKAKFIVALDVDTFQQAKKLVDKLYPTVKIFKVGSQLFTGCGHKAIEYINKKGAKVFLDLKYHDISNTVASAVAQATRLGVFMMTVHAQGGIEMLRAAKDSAAKTAKAIGKKPPLIVAVTVLTSQQFENVHQRVLDLADDAYASGVDGVVASVQEAGDIRKVFKNDFIIVTPGIRLAGVDKGDQKRVATPRDAIAAGSNYLVVGRPIVEAQDPLRAVQGFFRS